MRSLQLLAIVASLGLLTCSDRGTGPGGSPLPIPYQSEAEQMALYYSSEFRPPAPLTSRISRELAAIRSTFGQQIPEVNRPFVLPWVANVVTSGWTDSVAALIWDSAYAPFDRLVEQFDLEYAWYWRPRYITLWSEHPLHPWLLADSVRTIPGLTYAQPSEMGRPWGHFFARTEARGRADYYFWIEHCPELWGRLLWIQVRGGKAELKGEHYECPPEGYVAGWEQYVDDAETNRPAWVNKARDAFARLDYWGPSYEWRDR